MSEVDNAAEEILPAGTGAPESDAPLEESSPSQEETSAEAQPPKAKGVQKRLDELTAQRYAEQRARERAERDADHWRELALRSQTAEAPQTPDVPHEGKPKVEDFTSYEEFSEALADWKVEQKFAMREAQERQKREQEHTQTLQQRLESKQREFEAQAPDYRDVVQTVPYSEAIHRTIQESDMGPALLYHLGKNPQLAAQIVSLSPYQQAMRLGRLEVELSQPQPKRISGAPDPIRPVGGADGSIAYDPNSGTAEDYRKWRNQQLRKK